MFRIGLSQEEETLLAEIEKEYGEFNFPKFLSVHNVSPMELISAQLCVAFKPRAVKEIEFKSLAQLQSVVTDWFYIAKRNSFDVLVELDALASDETEKAVVETEEVPAGDDVTDEVADAETGGDEQDDKTPKKGGRGRRTNKKNQGGN